MVQRFFEVKESFIVGYGERNRGETEEEKEEEEEEAEEANSGHCLISRKSEASGRKQRAAVRRKWVIWVSCCFVISGNFVCHDCV